MKTLLEKMAKVGEALKVDGATITPELATEFSEIATALLKDAGLEGSDTMQQTAFVAKSAADLIGKIGEDGKMPEDMLPVLKATAVMAGAVAKQHDVIRKDATVEGMLMGLGETAMRISAHVTEVGKVDESAASALGEFAKAAMALADQYAAPGDSAEVAKLHAENAELKKRMDALEKEGTTDPANSTTDPATTDPATDTGAGGEPAKEGVEKSDTTDWSGDLSTPEPVKKD